MSRNININYFKCLDTSTSVFFSFRCKVHRFFIIRKFKFHPIPTLPSSLLIPSTATYNSNTLASFDGHLHCCFRHHLTVHQLLYHSILPLSPLYLLQCFTFSASFGTFSTVFSGSSFAVMQITVGQSCGQCTQGLPAEIQVATPFTFLIIRLSCLAFSVSCLASSLPPMLPPYTFP